MSEPNASCHEAEATFDPDAIEVVPGVTYYEIVNTFRNTAKQLGDYVTNTKEADRLRQLRVKAYAAQHPSGYEPNDVFGRYPSYGPVDPDHMLKEITLKKSTPKVLPEYSIFYGIKIVSARIKDHIEALEPGVHAFFPVLVRRADGSESYQYYFIQVLEELDCACVQLSGFRRDTASIGGYIWTRTPDEGKVYLWEDCVRGRHFFREKSALFNTVASDQLVKRLGKFLPRGWALLEAGVIRKKGN
ncbi:imm11 family protein [Rhodospira trueperi]|uniref:Immunity MXAN-0049 protein domain-containing protein n=1 Tax=Rhodospira trueperi TaxID=69960 RepID=A0A1G6W3G0_9PROT|nr:DUF1629 domain-containing protein [Rhodospira trueperi]SDD60344.1 Protein of unknown function [Rhodospira trueperi]